MKKIIALVFAVLYISAASGFVLNVHYCMGNFVGVDIDGKKSDTCGKCGMADSTSGCCHSESKIVKIDNSHKASSVVYNIEIPVSNLPVFLSFFERSNLNSDKIDLPVAYAPPIDIFPDLNILHSVFRV